MFVMSLSLRAGIAMREATYLADALDELERRGELHPRDFWLPKEDEDHEC